MRIVNIMMTTNSCVTKAKALEELSSSLYRDYHNLKKALVDEDIDTRTKTYLNRLGRTVETVRQSLNTIAKENK